MYRRLLLNREAFDRPRLSTVKKTPTPSLSYLTLLKPEVTPAPLKPLSHVIQDPKAPVEIEHVKEVLKTKQLEDNELSELYIECQVLLARIAYQLAILDLVRVLDNMVTDEKNACEGYAEALNMLYAKRLALYDVLQGKQLKALSIEPTGTPSRNAKDAYATVIQEKVPHDEPLDHNPLLDASKWSRIPELGTVPQTLSQKDHQKYADPSPVLDGHILLQPPPSKPVPLKVWHKRLMLQWQRLHDLVHDRLSELQWWLTQDTNVAQRLKQCPDTLKATLLAFQKGNYYVTRQHLEQRMDGLEAGLTLKT